MTAKQQLRSDSTLQVAQFKQENNKKVSQPKGAISVHLGQVMMSSTTTTTKTTPTTSAPLSSDNNNTSKPQNVHYSATNQLQLHSQQHRTNYSNQLEKNQVKSMRSETSAINSSSIQGSRNSNSTATTANTTAKSTQRSLNATTANQNQNQNQSYQVQYQEEFNRMRERLFRMLSKVPIQVETEPNSWSPIQRANSLPASTSSSSSSALSTCSRNSTSRRIDREPLLIKYYNDRFLNDILEQHFGCALIKHNFELGLALDAHLTPQQANQQSLHAFESRPELASLNAAFCGGEQQIFRLSSDNQLYQCQPELGSQLGGLEQCSDWQASQSNSCNFSWQMAAHYGPSLDAQTNSKKSANERRPTATIVKDSDVKYVPNSSQSSRRQQTKRQRVSNSTRLQNIALSNMVHSSGGPRNTQNGQQEQLARTQLPANNVTSSPSNGRNLSSSTSTSTSTSTSNVAATVAADMFSQPQCLTGEQHLLLIRQVNGKPAAKYNLVPGLVGNSSQLNQAFNGANFVTPPPQPLPNNNSQLSSIGQHEPESDNTGQVSMLSSLGDHYIQQQQQQQQHLQHHLNPIQNHDLYSQGAANYSQHQLQQLAAEPELACSGFGQATVGGQASLEQQLNQFGQHESSCYANSPQLAPQHAAIPDQQQQFLPADNSAYYQPQVTYLHVDGHTEWQCHSQPHQQEHNNNNNDHQQMIDQRQLANGLLCENLATTRRGHNFTPQAGSAYHFSTPSGATNGDDLCAHADYALLYHPDPRTQPNNNNGQLMIEPVHGPNQHPNGQLCRPLN